MKYDLFNFVIDARKLSKLLKDMYENGEIIADDYFLIEDQILLNSDYLAPEKESTIGNVAV